MSFKSSKGFQILLLNPILQNRCKITEKLWNLQIFYIFAIFVLQKSMFFYYFRPKSAGISPQRSVSHL